MDFFIAAKAPCTVYGETARTVQGDRSRPLATKPKLDIVRIRAYGRKMSTFGEWCAGQGMPLSYHHHKAAALETEGEPDLFMKHPGPGNTPAPEFRGCTMPVTWPLPAAMCCG